LTFPRIPIQNNLKFGVTFCNFLGNQSAVLKGFIDIISSPFILLCRGCKVLLFLLRFNLLLLHKSFSVLNYPALPVLGRALKISTKEGAGGWNLGEGRCVEQKPRERWPGEVVGMKTGG
jgi:hypothetical protein